MASDGWLTSGLWKDYSNMKTDLIVGDKNYGSGKVDAPLALSLDMGLPFWQGDYAPRRNPNTGKWSSAKYGIITGVHMMYKTVTERYKINAPASYYETFYDNLDRPTRFVVDIDVAGGDVDDAVSVMRKLDLRLDALKMPLTKVVLDSSDPGTKGSIHVVYQHIWFRNWKEQRAWALDRISAWQAATDVKVNSLHEIDVSLYSTKRAFRLPYCSKRVAIGEPKKPALRIYKPDDRIHIEDPTFAQFRIALGTIAEGDESTQPPVDVSENMMSELMGATTTQRAARVVHGGGDEYRWRLRDDGIWERRYTCKTVCPFGRKHSTNDHKRRYYPKINEVKGNCFGTACRDKGVVECDLEQADELDLEMAIEEHRKTKPTYEPPPPASQSSASSVMMEIDEGNSQPVAPPVFRARPPSPEPEPVPRRRQRSPSPEPQQPTKRARSSNWGGARPGAGRPKGSINAATLEAKRIAEARFRVLERAAEKQCLLVIGVGGDLHRFTAAGTRIMSRHQSGAYWIPGIEGCPSMTFSGWVIHTIGDAYAAAEHGNDDTFEDNPGIDELCKEQIYKLMDGDGKEDGKMLRKLLALRVVHQYKSAAQYHVYLNGVFDVDKLTFSPLREWKFDPKVGVPDTIHDYPFPIPVQPGATIRFDPYELAWKSREALFASKFENIMKMQNWRERTIESFYAAAGGCLFTYRPEQMEAEYYMFITAERSTGKSTIRNALAHMRGKNHTAQLDTRARGNFILQTLEKDKTFLATADDVQYPPEMKTIMQMSSSEPISAEKKNQMRDSIEHPILLLMTSNNTGTSWIYQKEKTVDPDALRRRVRMFLMQRKVDDDKKMNGVQMAPQWGAELVPACAAFWTICVNDYKRPGAEQDQSRQMLAWRNVYMSTKTSAFQLFCRLHVVDHPGFRMDERELVELYRDEWCAKHRIASDMTSDHTQLAPHMLRMLRESYPRVMYNDRIHQFIGIGVNKELADDPEAHQLMAEMCHQEDTKVCPADAYGNDEPSDDEPEPFSSQ